MPIHTLLGVKGPCSVVVYSMLRMIMQRSKVGILSLGEKRSCYMHMIVLGYIHVGSAQMFLVIKSTFKYYGMFYTNKELAKIIWVTY